MRHLPPTSMLCTASAERGIGALVRGEWTLVRVAEAQQWLIGGGPLDAPERTPGGSCKAYAVGKCSYGMQSSVAR